MTIVDPIQMPLAGGQAYQNSDVKHLSQTDELSYLSISAATRNLAYRDAAIANKLNEVVAAVNNREQYINLPSIRTVIGASATETVANYRVPTGFEARVINAIISSSGHAARLKVQWSSGTFGSVTVSGDGTAELVSTTGEATAGTKFVGAGEIIVLITGGSAALEVVASVTLSLRPLSIPTSGILSPGAIGLTGPSGPAGGQGSQGLTGPQGSPGSDGSGFAWQGAWSSGTTYSINDVVTVTTDRTIAYVAKTVSTGLAPASRTSNWDIFTAGAVGPVGPGLSLVGTWNPLTTYASNNIVSSAVELGYIRLFVAKTDITGDVANLTPMLDVANWEPLLGPQPGGARPMVKAVTGYYTCEAGYVAGTGSTGYQALSDVGSTATSFPYFREASFYTGMASLSLSLGLTFKGTINVQLPKRYYSQSLTVVSTAASGTLSGPVIMGSVKITAGATVVPDQGYTVSQNTAIFTPAGNIVSAALNYETGVMTVTLTSNMPVTVTYRRPDSGELSWMTPNGTHTPRTFTSAIGTVSLVEAEYTTSGVVSQVPMVPGTLTLTIGATTTTDNGNGEFNLVSHLVSSFINYTTGAITVVTDVSLNGTAASVGYTAVTPDVDCSVVAHDASVTALSVVPGLAGSTYYYAITVTAPAAVNVLVTMTGVAYNTAV